MLLIQRSGAMCWLLLFCIPMANGQVEQINSFAYPGGTQDGDSFKVSKLLSFCGHIKRTRRSNLAKVTSYEYSSRY